MNARVDYDTYAHYAALEPRLSQLLERARTTTVRPGQAEMLFMRHFKADVVRLAGFESAVPELRTHVVYEIAYNTVLDALIQQEGC